MSALHAAPVLVIKHRRALVTHEKLAVSEHTMRDVCADLNVEPADSNNGTDRGQTRPS